MRIMTGSSRPVGGLIAGVIAGLALSACALSPGKVGYLVRSPHASPLVVRTEAGDVRGAATPLGQAFLGIPFAAPPTGSLRFRPPAPPAAWTGVRDATRPGAICIQDAFPGSGRQSEDCLSLDVYAPHDAAPSRPRPVMIWLYGGGFSGGDNVEYDPSRLAENRGVIVVAPNYRLGPFGFLAHPALRGDGEGAYALLDQQAALKWVKGNIAAFGGDPNAVTLFGQSAGGWSVCYQLTAPGARGLFQRAIIQSGSCVSPHSEISLTAAEVGGRRMAATLGCGDGEAAGDCLRRLPARALLKARPDRRGLLGLNSWSAAYGGDVLPAEPRVAFAAGDFAVMPVIDGTTRDEGRLFLFTNRLQGKLFTRASYEKILTESFEADTPQVLAEYAGEAKRSRGLAYADVVTDSTFACPALALNALLERRAEAGGPKVWAYEFDDPHAAATLPPTPFTPPLKAFHTSELAYLFQTPWLVANPPAFDPAQRRLSDRIQAWWAAFAAKGDPNIPGAPDWPPDHGQGPLTLSPVSVAVSSDFAAAHHCAFWKALGY
jgi:para-nitrobenzyl esterase